MVPTQALSQPAALDCNPDARSEQNRAPALSLSRPLRDLFRLILRLARRTGFCFARVAKLAQMLGKCERSIRYGLRKLLESGWIERQFDGRHLFLRPLVDLPEPDPTPRPRRPFSRPAVAALIAGLKPKSCRSDPYKKTDGRDNNRAPGNVVVSSSPDPGILAAAEAAVRAYAERHAVRSMGALLTAAIKGKWTPPAPVRDHPSDRTDRPVRVVTAPKGWSLSRNRSDRPARRTSAALPFAAGHVGAALHGGQKAPTDAQEPQRAVPGLAPVSTSSSALSPALAAILGRCEARKSASA